MGYPATYSGQTHASRTQPDSMYSPSSAAQTLSRPPPLHSWPETGSLSAQHRISYDSESSEHCVECLPRWLGGFPAIDMCWPAAHRLPANESPVELVHTRVASKPQPVPHVSQLLISGSVHIRAS